MPKYIEGSIEMRYSFTIRVPDDFRESEKDQYVETLYASGDDRFLDVLEDHEFFDVEVKEHG